MMVRTTKQIIDSVDFYEMATTDYSQQNDKWVCLESLKKEIVDAFKERLAEDYILMEEDIDEVMNKVLCNSSEQKKCTCPQPMPLLPEEIKNCICGRCGGAL